MAHSTQVTGKVSELTAALALISNGWEVSSPIIDEVYDLVGKDPINGAWATFQVKTIRKRTDRKNEMVIYSTKGNGEAYQPHDCDYILGVDGDRVFMAECTGVKEMWASEASAAKRWVELTAVAEEITEAEAV